MLVKTNDSNTSIVQFPYSRMDLRTDNPNTSFPKVPVDLTDFNTQNVTELPEPTYDASAHRVSRHAEPAKVGNDWELDWDILPLPAIQIIENTFATESEAARGSLTSAEINSYEGMWAEVQARHGDPGAPTDQIEAFATEMGITPGNAVTLIRDKLRPYKLGISTALAKREKALIALP